MATTEGHAERRSPIAREEVPHRLVHGESVVNWEYAILAQEPFRDPRHAGEHQHLIAMISKMLVEVASQRAKLNPGTGEHVVDHLEDFALRNFHGSSLFDD